MPNGEYIHMKRLDIIKKIHFYLAFCFTVVGLIGEWKNWFDDQNYIFILIGLSWVTTIFYLYFKQYVFQGVLLLFTLASGIYGFWEHSWGPYKHTFFNACYSTIRLFFLDTDTVFNEGANKYIDLPLPVELARWTAAFYTISTIAQLILKYFGLSLKGEIYRHLGGHIVVLGYNYQSSIFIKNLVKEKHRVVVISEALSDGHKKELFELGVPVFYTDSIESKQLEKKSGINKACYLILFHEDDSVNLETYISVRSSVKPINKEHLPVFLHLEHAKSLQIYEGLLLEEKKNVKSYTFSSSMLIAEKMLDDHPLYEGYEHQLRKENGDPLHILFIGFGKRNQYLAFHMLNLGHFLTKEKINFTIFDRDIEKVQKEWSYLAKKAKDLANIQFHRIDLNNQSLSDELNKVEVPVTHVYLSLQDDFLDLVEGLELNEKLPNVPIFLKMRDNHKVSNWLDAEKNKYKNVKRYANLGEVLNSKYVLNEDLRSIAKEAHKNYLKRKEDLGKGKDKSWEQLNTFKQESTRFQMLHNDTKLMLLGLKKVSKTNKQFEEYKNANKFLDELEFAKHINPFIEPLAKIEHERWNSFHFLRGWEVPKKDHPFYGDKPELAKQKLHPDLVPWNELGDDMKKYDRDSIIFLQIYYNAQDFELIEEANL